MSTQLKNKKVLIIYRQETVTAQKMAQEVSQWLAKKSITIYSHPKQKISKEVTAITTQSLGRLSLVIALGGDGTYLEAVRLLKGRKVPILGVNMGSLGFLTETRIEELYPTLELTLNSRMEMRPRSMVRIKVKTKNKIRYQCSALNDVVIERGGGKNMITLSAYCEHQHICDYKADGLIIAAPTGSTAYNLAAGGPILHPEVKSFVVTPICPHSLTNRPILFPENKTLIFKFKESQNKAFLNIDGQKICDISQKDEVSVQLDSKMHFVLRRPDHNYFNLLREKLKFGAHAVF